MENKRKCLFDINKINQKAYLDKFIKKGNVKKLLDVYEAVSEKMEELVIAPLFYIFKEGQSGNAFKDDVLESYLKYTLSNIIETLQVYLSTFNVSKDNIEKVLFENIEGYIVKKEEEKKIK